MTDKEQKIVDRFSKVREIKHQLRESLGSNIYYKDVEKACNGNEELINLVMNSLSG
jgi:hypothetical protein